MNEIKLIFTGSLNAGKTAAINTISEIPMSHTNMQMPEHDGNYGMCVRKENLITIDYGELTLADGRRLRLYGTPGQDHLEYIWKMLIKSAIGIVVLINNAGSDPIGELARCLDNCREVIGEIPTVIAISHMDITPTPNLQSYRDYLQQRRIELPLFLIDPRRYESVMQLVRIFTEKLGERDFEFIPNKIIESIK